MDHTSDRSGYENVTPSFDVYCLAKTLWSMVSGKSKMNLWYFNDPEWPQFNVEALFPGNLAMKFANDVFSKCIVEKERQCLPNAEALKAVLAELLEVLERKGSPVGDDIERYCQVCGRGKYLRMVDRNHIDGHNFGIGERGNQIVFACSHCGHIDLFVFDDKSPSKVWRPKRSR